MADLIDIIKNSAGVVADLVSGDPLTPAVYANYQQATCNVQTKITDAVYGSVFLLSAFFPGEPGYTGLEFSQVKLTFDGLNNLIVPITSTDNETYNPSSGDCNFRCLLKITKLNPANYSGA